MAPSAATKLHPYLVYLLGLEVALLGLALAFGAFLLLRHFLKKRPFDGNPAVENKEIALQIQQEIQRLVELRNRIDPSLAKLADGSSIASAAQTVAPASGADVKALEEKHQLELKSLNEKLAALEAELKIAKEKPAAAPADGTPAAAATPEEITKLKEEIAKEKEELQQQVVHLETVVSEYRIFEEDFALVKKFKTENDELKVQVADLLKNLDEAKMAVAAAPSPAPVPTVDPVQSVPVIPAAPAPANPELSEQDITNLFQSFDMPAGEPVVQSAPEPAPTAEAPTEEFDPIAALAATPDPDPLAELAAAPVAPMPQPDVAPSALSDVAPSALSDVAPSAPPDANEIEAFFKAQDEAAGKTGDDADALLAELHAAAAEKTTQQAVEAAEPEPQVPKGYEVEPVKSEPDVGLQSLAKTESMEDLAEGAAGDDKLMEEFQKILQNDKAG